MTASDLSNILIGTGGVIATGFLMFIGWLLKHSNRLTIVEVKTEGVEKRLDRLEQSILARLDSIDLKLDHKADRS